MIAQKTVDQFVGTLLSLLSTNWLFAVASGLATVVSIVALTFVVRRNTGPSSRTLRPDKVSEEEIDKRSQEVVQLVIKKEYLRGLVSEYLERQASKPRFTFKEFVLFAMPAIVTFFLLGLTGYLILSKPEIVLDPKQGLPSFITQSFAAIVGYYFGTAASKA